MMEAGWLTRRVARELGSSNCVPTASSAAIRAQVATLLGTPVSSRTIRKRLAEGHLGSWHPLRKLLLTPTHQSLRLESCCARGNWIAADWNQIIFSDESRFRLSSDDNFVRVWRPRGEFLNYVFVLQRHSCNGSQEPFFNKAPGSNGMGVTRQSPYKSTLHMLLFLYLPDPQICFQSNISGIFWDDELGISQV
ncbi:transposable element Tcb2 transposase [Trichonephila clavipes]|nr:transposable element Tcb2 transposase [Trichonephila clavipes]